MYNPTPHRADSEICQSVAQKEAPQHRSAPKSLGDSALICGQQNWASRGDKQNAPLAPEHQTTSFIHPWLNWLISSWLMQAVDTEAAKACLKALEVTAVGKDPGQLIHHYNQGSWTALKRAAATGQEKMTSRDLKFSWPESCMPWLRGTKRQMTFSTAGPRQDIYTGITNPNPRHMAKGSRLTTASQKQDLWAMNSTPILTAAHCWFQRAASLPFLI